MKLHLYGSERKLVNRTRVDDVTLTVVICGGNITHTQQPNGPKIEIETGINTRFEELQPGAIKLQTGRSISRSIFSRVAGSREPV